MRRLQPFGFTTLDATPPAPAQPARPSVATPPPRDEMWRSRRVLSGSNWMDAWVRKPHGR